MSRIKYPGEQEMKRQIQVILDESGMFEDDEKSQGYTECVHPMMIHLKFFYFYIFLQQHNFYS